MKILGLTLQNDLKWKSNTRNMINKAYKRLWILTRLENKGADKSTLRVVYFRHIRSIVEFVVPLWNRAITQKEVKRLDRVQKLALNIIYSSEQSYKKIAKYSNSSIWSKEERSLSKICKKKSHNA